MSLMKSCPNSSLEDLRARRPGASRASLVACASLGALGAGSALAAGDQPAQALSEVVVTAQKVQQNIQDVPMGIESLSGPALVDAGMVNLADYSRLATDLNVVPTGSGYKGAGTVINMRGVSPSVGNPTVAFYIDDTPDNGQFIFRAGGMDPRLYDIERVEILKGPQGNLYGASAMGGLIKIVTRKPVLDKWEFGFDLTGSNTRYGGYNSSGEGVINIPLIEDKAALRVTASLVNDSGFIRYVSPFANGAPSSPTNVPTPYIPLPQTDKVNSSTLTAVRGTLLVEPVSWLRIEPAVYTQSSRLNALNAVYPDMWGYQVPTQSPYGGPQGVESDFTLASLNVAADVGFGNITSNTGYVDGSGDSADDLAPLLTGALLGEAPTVATAAYIGPLMNHSTLFQFTQELRFASSWQGPFSVLGGLWYESWTETDYQLAYLKEGGEAVLGVPTNLMFALKEPTGYASDAAYVNFTYKFASRFELQAGGRYTQIHLHDSRAADGVLNGGPSAYDFRARQSAHPVSVSLSDHLTDDTMLYTRAAQGYRAGFAGSAPPPLVCPGAPGAANGEITVQPDKTWNYELGAKTTWAGGRVQFNATLFEIKYTDIQQAEALPCGYSYYANAGSATSKGIETELDAKLGAFGLHAGVGYVDAKLDTAAPAIGAMAGESLEQVPKLTGNVSVDYYFQLPVPDYQGYAQISYRYVGKRTGDYGNGDGVPTPDLIAAQYSLTDLRLGATQGHWDYSVFVSNLFDTRAQLGFDQIGARLGYINRPRTIGLTVRRRL